jgi:hypothetical protein
MIETQLPEPPPIHPPVLSTDNAARSMLCERCGRGIARVYKVFGNRHLRVCDHCAKLADRVH